MLVVVASLVLAVVAAAWSQAWITLPGQSRYAELNAQLRDRAAVAYLGRRPWGVANSSTPWCRFRGFQGFRARFRAPT